MFDNLSFNIKQTIGNIEYEIIKIDNIIDKLSISNAYNKGIKLSSYNILCFIHEDINFISVGWGEKLLDFFKENINTGVIGVAGSKVHCKAPGSWFNTPVKYHVKNIVQNNNNSLIREQVGFERSHSHEQVVVVDGVFMIANKINGILFDDKIKGFHGYDLVYSLIHANAGLKNYVINDILLEHNSIGNINKDWLKSMFQVYLIYRRFLPIGVSDCSSIKIIEKKMFKNFVHKCFDFGYKFLALKAYYFFFLRFPFSISNIFFFRRIFK